MAFKISVGAVEPEQDDRERLEQRRASPSKRVAAGGEASDRGAPAWPPLPREAEPEQDGAGWAW
ncbi:MAG: hypothetical protein OEZ06_06385 [Myxococcales bacterium]|nr:hypothetical protein [Myxococcales bacterium]